MLETIRLDATVDLQAAAGNKPIRISILAYTGGIMAVSGFGDVAIELAGLDLPSSIPLLADHAETLDGIAGVGKPIRASGNLTVEGTLSLANDSGQRILQLSRDGVPLQASVGIQPTDRQALRPGEKATVNGRQLTAGPRGLTVVRGGRLREVSILPLGADSQTQVSIAAKAHPMNDDESTNEQDPIQLERTRVQGIVAACRGEHGELQAKAIADGWTLEQTKAAVLDAVRAARPTSPAHLTQRDTHAHGSPRDTLAAAALLMAGQADVAVKAFGERMAHNVKPPTGWPELCAMALRLSGRDVPSDRNELIKAAFSTTDMPNALGLGVQKVALETFLEQSANWRAIARIVSAADFKDGKAIRLSAASRFEPVGPTGELKHGNLAEDAFDFKIDTWGKMFGVTRQSIINDDLGLLSELPTVLGSEAARSVSDLFFGTLTGATPFFVAEDGNLLEEDSALGVESLGVAIKMLRTRKDRDNRIIGFVPTTLLVPAALESTARQVLNSTQLWRDQSTDQQPTGNPFAGINLALVVEPRLDADNPASWYLFSQPRHAALLVAFLNGRQSPVVESVAPPSNVLGEQWRGYLDFGVALGESRAAIKATGAADD